MPASSDSTRYFQTNHLLSDLKNRAVRGGVAIASAQICKFVLQMGSTMVLARLLTPEHYGLIGMVAAISGFLMMFKDLGLSMATVQKEKISHEQISTLFWVNVSLSFILMLVTASISPVIAWFYGEPRLTFIALAMSGAFIFSGLTVQHQALLRRQMRFTALALIEITSLFVSIIIAIASAYLGAQYWALVIMQITQVIITALGVWIICRWVPGLPVWQSGVRSMLAFGGYLSGENLVGYLLRNIDNVLIGRFWGPQQLGLYAKAFQLLLLPIAQFNVPISSVALPTLSRLQKNPDRYAHYYYKSASLIAFLTTPIILTLAALSDEIIALILGDKWMGASPIFKVLAIAAIWHPISNTTAWVYISLGQTDRKLRWTLFLAPMYIFAFVLGLRWGAIGVATSYAICTNLLQIPHFFYAFKYSPIKVFDFINATWRPIAISLFIYININIIRNYIAFMNPGWFLFISCITSISTFLFSLIFWPKARNEGLQLIKIIGSLK